MVAWKVPRRRAKTVFWAAAIILLPTQVAYQDLGALLVQQPGVIARARKHLIVSPFGTIHAAMFSLPRPLGTSLPHPPVYTLANFDPNDVAGSIGSQMLGDLSAPLQFPTVNRKPKGNLLSARPRQPLPPLPPLLAIAPTLRNDADGALKQDSEVRRIDPYIEYEFGAPSHEPQSTDIAPQIPKSLARLVPDAAEKDSIFFDTGAVDAGRLRPWAPGEAPVVGGDPDLKLSALAPNDDNDVGESVANKGQVTGENARPKSPAERLALSGAARAKAEKCLANAVYFEARDEPVRAQIAVAQVVLNRVFSPFYPNDICGVVYQNANRHLACQFTFACDGKRNIISEPDAWARATHIARDMLDGKLWMPEVAKSTHYHDYWAHPDWVGEMKRIDRLGGLIFYRPRAWGDGSNEPIWGDPKITAKEAAKL